MDKRYQVFVSSTYEDLQDERKEVMQALLELDCIPAGMELFPASNDDQWTLIKRVIDDCDYYLLIIGGKYGSTNDEGISYTQMEFEYALGSGKPIISFLHKHPENIPSGKSEQDSSKKEKLIAFKEMVKKKLVKFWETPQELGSVVSRSMVRLIKDYPSEGWIKSSDSVDEASLQEIARLQKENAALKAQLKTISTSPPKGTEAFSQGDDKVDISFSFQGRDSNENLYSCNSSLSFTWDDLFETIAPYMIDECSETTMISALNTLIQKYSKKIGTQSTFRNLKKLSFFNIHADSYNQIKVQFKALGLMCLSNRKRSTKNNDTYWTLTPYGDFIMTQLLAIRKQ